MKLHRFVLISFMISSCTFTNTHIVTEQDKGLKITPAKEKCVFTPPLLAETPTISKDEFQAIEATNTKAQLAYILAYTKRLMEHDVRQQREMAIHIARYKECLAKE